MSYSNEELYNLCEGLKEPDWTAFENITAQVKEGVYVVGGVVSDSKEVQEITACATLKDATKIVKFFKHERMSYYLKYHHCDECDVSWDDEWNCLCNDECPECGAEIEPHDHEEIDHPCVDFD